MSDLTNEPLGAGRVETRELDQEVRTSFLDYAMSVIVSRALPDVRDGLKPVHRRVLYAMHEAGLQPNRPTRKSARVVGDVMGNYHPHGDSAIYDALVRLAQPFSMRYPLIDGQGYFGSVDGDPAGAMRYCVAGDTRVATARGTVRIDSIISDAEPESERVARCGRRSSSTPASIRRCGFEPARDMSLLARSTTRCSASSTWSAFRS